MPANAGYQIRLKQLFDEAIPGGDFGGAGNDFGTSAIIESACAKGIMPGHHAYANTVQRFKAGMPPLGVDRLLAILIEVRHIQEEIRQFYADQPEPSMAKKGK